MVDKEIEKVQISSLLDWREVRHNELVQSSIEQLKDAARKKKNIMPASIDAAKAGVTTGEWADAMREVFGEFRAPTGVTVSKSLDSESLPTLQKKVKEVSKKLKRNIKLLIGKPGLDGHSNGAEQIAMRAKEAGFDVVYQGIRLTPNQIVNSALEEAVHIIGLSILSGSHLEILEDLMTLLKVKKMTKIPVIVGGIIPEKDFEKIRSMGISKIYTPKDYDLNKIILDMSKLVEQNAA